ncbi:hypothetical protein J7J13_01140 [bacterium]|nr:hypothetical protein [bacterium]
MKHFKFKKLLSEARLKTFLAILLIILLDSLMLFVYSFNRDIQKENKVIVVKAEVNKDLENKINEMVAGYPMENMARYIARKDEKVAAFMVSIAKKESDWGKRVPVLNGQDCYNYWGYREKRERMGTDGHTCFNNPRDAVNTVAGRIDKLVYENKLDTPRKMVVWKCGSSCAGQNPKSVNKWISDVDWYFRKLVN